MDVGTSSTTRLTPYPVMTGPTSKQRCYTAIMCCREGFIAWLVSLHLRCSCLADYDPAQHFGGMIYCFIRGLDAPGNGVWFDRPSLHGLDATSATSSRCCGYRNDMYRPSPQPQTTTAAGWPWRRLLSTSRLAMSTPPGAYHWPPCLLLPAVAKALFPAPALDLPPATALCRVNHHR